MEHPASAKLDANTLERLRRAWVAGADAVICAQMEGDRPCWGSSSAFP